MKNILITGALGFLGFNLGKLLVHNFPMYNVIGIDNEGDDKYVSNRDILLSYNNYVYIKGDVLNKELIHNIFMQDHGSLNQLSSIKGIDVVYTTAFDSAFNDLSIEGLDFYQNNILGPLNISLEYLLAKNTCKKLVYLSSAYVYGFSSDDTLFTENSLLNPSSKSATVRVSVEMLLKSLHDNFNLPVVVVRAPSIFGDGLKGNHLLMNILSAVMNGEHIEIDFSPRSKINVIFYEDLIIGLESMIKFPGTFEVFNMGGENISLEDFVTIAIDCFYKISGVKRDRDIVVFKNRLRGSSCISSDKIYREVGWKNYTPVEYGVEKTMKRMLNA